MAVKGSAPVMPGFSQTSGLSPDSISPMHMVSMMMGMRPGQPDSTTEKMATIVQLLREVSKEDPRLAMLTSDALKLLLEGPSSGQAGAPVSPVPPNGTPGSIIPMGGGGSQLA